MFLYRKLPGPWDASHALQLQKDFQERFKMKDLTRMSKQVAYFMTVFNVFKVLNALSCFHHSNIWKYTFLAWPGQAKAELLF